MARFYVIYIWVYNSTIPWPTNHPEDAPISLNPYLVRKWTDMIDGILHCHYIQTNFDASIHFWSYFDEITLQTSRTILGKVLSLILGQSIEK